MTRIRIALSLLLFVIIFGACTSEKDQWKDLNEKFLSDNANKSGVQKLKSGVQYKVLTEGSGLIPGSGSIVKIVYTGKLIDGTMFDSTVNDTTWVNTASSGYISNYVSGFKEALSKMKTGSRWEVYIPQALGYGSESSYSAIPAYSTLIFDIQLLGFR